MNLSLEHFERCSLVLPPVHVLRRFWVCSSLFFLCVLSCLLPFPFYFFVPFFLFRSRVCVYVCVYFVPPAELAGGSSCSALKVCVQDWQVVAYSQAITMLLKRHPTCIWEEPVTFFLGTVTRSYPGNLNVFPISSFLFRRIV